MQRADDEPDSEPDSETDADRAFLAHRCKLFARACAGSRGAAEQRAFVQVCADLRVLSEQAAAAWTPGFRRALADATSFRVVRERADALAALKEPGEHRCAACGRPEWRGRATLDLGGPEVSSGCWISGDLELFHERLQGFFDCYDGGLRANDLGSYALGACCQRKAKLFFWLATLPLLHGYDSAVLARDRGSSWEYAGEELALQLSEELQALREAVADESARVEDPPQDANFWKDLDARRAAAGDSLERLLLRGQLRCGGGGPAVGAGSAGGKRRRRAVVRSDSEGDSGGDSGGEGGSESERERGSGSQEGGSQEGGSLASRMFGLAARLAAGGKREDAALAGEAAAALLGA